jgi:hypothetical protein
LKGKIDTSFFEKLERTYFELAFTELAMDYYCLREKDMENAAEKGSSGIDEYRERTEKLIKSCFTEYDRLEETGKAAEEIRKELKAKVEIFVKKIDRLELDSYVLQREENPDEKYDYPDDDEAAKVVLRSIFSVNDNAVINERIRSAIYELPVRMTKIRFFDIMKNGLKLYIGAGRDILERAVYMLESTSGLAGDEIDEQSLVSGERADIQKEYEYLNELAGICNYICVIGKCDVDIRSKEKENIDRLLELIKVSSELDEEKSHDAEQILSKLEGKLEELAGKLAVYEAKLAGYLESVEEPDEKAIDLEMMRRLMSSSVYADLEQIEPDEADAEDVEKAFEKLSQKLSESFKNGDRKLNRARMAACLSALPVFFNSRTDVMNYVRESLSSCSNIHEKNIAISNIVDSGYSEEFED